MRRQVASWLLYRLVSEPHADALIGDILELAADDPVTCDRLLFETLWSLLLPVLAGFLLAVTVGGASVVGLESAFFSSLARHAASHSQQAWGSTRAFLAGCLFVMACFSVVRYGIRDRLTQLLVACIPPLAASALFWWISGVPAIAAALVLALTFGSLLRPGSRRLFLALPLLAALQSVLWFGAVGMLLKPLAALWRHAPATAIALKPFAFTAFAMSYAALILLTCITYARVHHWMCA